MFISRKDTIEYSFYSRMQGYRIVIQSPEEWGELDEEAQAKYEKHKVVFRPLTWGAQNECRRAGICEDPTTGMREWDGEAYVMEKLSQAIVDWDFAEEDENGDKMKVPVSREAIAKLHPALGDHLVAVYDKKTELTEQEEKN
jgi:hypothetical protein